MAVRHRRNRRLLAAADLTGVALTLLIAVALVHGASARWPAVLLLALVPIAGKLQGLYHRDQVLVMKTSLDEGPRLFQLAAVYVMALWLCGGVALSGSLSRAQAVVLLAGATVLPLLTRRGARGVARMITERERCLFIGSPGAASRLRARLEGNVHATLVEHLTVGDARATVREQGAQIDALRYIVEIGDIHRVIIEADDDPDAVYDLVRGAKQLGVRVSLVPGVFAVIGTSVEIDELAGMILLGLRPFGLSRSSALLKRAFDVVGASFALIASVPVLVVVAVAIKLDSAGPVFFRQTRVGRDGRPFQIVKFRTMSEGADLRKGQLAHRNEAEGLFKIADDPRITRVGGVLRRTSLDELPQLGNVLRGDMSLVGPRPLVQDEDAKITGWDRRRLLLTPGMTGPWQIAGSARIPLADMVKIDYRYIGGWSLWTDCKILLRTIPYALARRGL